MHTQNKDELSNRLKFRSTQYGSILHTQLPQYLYLQFLRTKNFKLLDNSSVYDMCLFGVNSLRMIRRISRHVGILVGKCIH